MKQNIREKRHSIKFTNKEKDKFNQVWQSLQYECNISPKRQSEIFIEGFFQYAEKLINSKDIHTQTIQQLNNKEIKVDALNKIKGFIHSQPKKFSEVFNYFFRTFSEQFGSYRTRFTWLKHLFESEEFVILNLKSKFGDYFVIPKNSYFHAQFINHCFRFPSERLDYQPTAENPAKKTIYDLLNMNFHAPNTLDKVEEFAVKAFIANYHHEEKPMINEPVISEIMKLRSDWKHDQAIELLKQEIEFKQKQSIEIAETEFNNILEVKEE